ncbi:MAG: HAD family phosphatase [Candidatus Colwellbacteria bacterium]|nr:HAD family phosphatase [Candidatus Colwellbacteria bacterium]
MKENKSLKLAIFDIDGTIFRSSLVVELVNGLVNEGVFPQEAKKEMEADYLAWLDRKGGYEKYIDQVVKIYVVYIRGCRKTDVDRVVAKVIDWQKDRVYRFTRDLIKKLKGDGYYLIAISGSPEFIVSKFAEYAGFNVFFGSVLEIKEGVFTGNVISKDAWRDKEKVLAKFIEEEHINADLGHSIAVGDTDGDIPLLEMVGRPIAFNPNRKLAQYAKKKGWKIVVERKDVIYEIKDFSFGE